MAPRTQHRANTPAPLRAHGPAPALREPQAHSTRAGLAPDPREGDAARVGAVTGLAARGVSLRLGGRIRPLPEAAEGPGDLDAAADAPEPDESEDGRGEEHVQHGEEVGVAGGGWEEELEDVESEAAGVDELGRGAVVLEGAWMEARRRHTKERYCRSEVGRARNGL